MGQAGNFALLANRCHRDGALADLARQTGDGYTCLHYACINDDEISFQSMVLRPLALSIRWKRDGRRGVSESPSMMGRVDGVEGAGRRHAVAGRGPRDSCFAHAGYIVKENEVERYYSVLGRVDTPPSHAQRGRRDASTPPRESRRALRELRQSADGFVPRRRSATSSSRRRCSTARTTR